MSDEVEESKPLSSGEKRWKKTSFQSGPSPLDDVVRSEKINAEKLSRGNYRGYDGSRLFVMHARCMCACLDCLFLNLGLFISSPTE